jgi:hypothetical protein
LAQLGASGGAVGSNSARMLTLPTTETAGQHGTAANAITLRLRLLS